VLNKKTKQKSNRSIICENYRVSARYMKVLGHTIVGDATTPQLCATFFGDQPENLKPEGRRGFRGAETIDKWPSLLKDLVKDGYATMHSEDEPFINSFNFRLHGFKKQPTLKYLRPWWRESNDLRKIKYWRSNSCPINFAMDYTKNFYKEYSEELSAVFLMNSALTHNEPERVQMLDNGFIKFFQYLNESKRLESTAVIFFGDHGMREGGFRSTIQGKLEERLPFMTITLPPIFYQRHPELVKNLQRNSKALTTPYDIHATLKHLIQFTSGEIPKHKFGRSLFTNIVSLNRECGEAGVTPFWCVCRNFAPVKNLNDPTVREIATAITNSINEVVFKNEIAKPQCQTLSLDQIHRASKMIRAAKDDGAFQSYELVLKLKPCGGLFEATAEYDIKNKKVNVGKNFSRINLYRDQPKCIQQQFPYLRKFCCCNGQF
uniref:Uncharacterized protein n=1 Tax=Clytia hemisphaerica TaxID=252671 RepID=A0A7M5X3Q0_9CNID